MGSRGVSDSCSDRSNGHGSRLTDRSDVLLKVFPRWEWGHPRRGICIGKGTEHHRKPNEIQGETFPHTVGREGEGIE